MIEPMTLDISARFDTGAETCSIPLSPESCWCALLGCWPLPVEGAIDQLASFFHGRRPERITLQGCPSACLLPLLWTRTIWFQTSTPATEIQWQRVEDPSDTPSRQSAGMLACMLADETRCADTDAAWRLWGYSAEHRPVPETSFDLLTGILDLWDPELGRVAQAADWTQTMRRALVECDALGRRRVGIYGAGTHTRAVGEALMEPGVEIVCIIDDDARRHGQRMWGYEIVSRETALELGLDTVILSANSLEDTLWARTRSLRERGIAVVPLYMNIAQQGDQLPAGMEARL